VNFVLLKLLIPPNRFYGTRFQGNSPRDGVTRDAERNRHVVL